MRVIGFDIVFEAFAVSIRLLIGKIFVASSHMVLNGHLFLEQVTSFADDRAMQVLAGS